LNKSCYSELQPSVGGVPFIQTDWQTKDGWRLKAPCHFMPWHNKNLSTSFNILQPFSLKHFKSIVSWNHVKIPGYCSQGQDSMSNEQKKWKLWVFCIYNILCYHLGKYHNVQKNSHVLPNKVSYHGKNPWKLFELKR